MYRNKQLTLDGVFGYNRLLVNGVDVAPTINTNSQDISYIYNEALINTSNDILSTAKITEAVSSLTQTNTQDIKAIKTSLKDSFIQQGNNINLNSDAKLQFPSTYPGNTPVNNNNAGLALYWNSMGHGETDLLCYGKDQAGGLTITSATNSRPPAQICRFLRNFIGFTFAPHFPTTEVIGMVGATTEFVNDRITILTNEINTSKTNISNNTSSINNLNTKTSTNTTSINSINSELLTIKNANTSNGTDLTIIKAQQTSNNTMITNLSNQVLALQTTVQAYNATISRLTTDITALNAKVDALMRK